MIGTPASALDPYTDQTLPSPGPIPRDAGDGAGCDVMPEFHAHEPAQEAWKRQVLAREIELEEIDTAPFRERYGPNSVQVRAAAE